MKKEYQNLEFIDASSCPNLDCDTQVLSFEFNDDEVRSKARLVKDISIIYDGQCFSACEIFIILMQEYGKVRTFSNDRSMNSYQYSGALSVKLPDSKIIISVPRQRRFFRYEKRYKEGIIPQIKIDEKISIEEFIRKYY